MSNPTVHAGTAFGLSCYNYTDQLACSRPLSVKSVRDFVVAVIEVKC